MKKHFIIFCLLAAVITIIAAPAFAVGGNWSEKAVWAGDPNDAVGQTMAQRFTAKIDDFQISIPVYDVFICYKAKGASKFLPITSRGVEIRKGRPMNIHWIGKYNGFNEEKISSFDDNDDTVNTRFTCTTSPSGNKFYGLDGIITWTKATKRDQDRICVVWDETMRARVYLGITFPDLMESIGIQRDLPGYTTTNDHDNMFEKTEKK